IVSSVSLLAGVSLRIARPDRGLCQARIIRQVVMTGGAGSQVFFAQEAGLLLMAGAAVLMHGVLEAGSQVGERSLTRFRGHILVAVHTCSGRLCAVFALVALHTGGVPAVCSGVHCVVEDRLGNIIVTVTVRARGAFILRGVDMVTC